MATKRIIFVAAALVAFASPVPAQQEPPTPQGAQPEQESFLFGLSDIPLMPGLAENEAATVFFDKPAGRIMIAHPLGCVDRGEARRFYAATLPQLGWLPADGASSLTYLREGEGLTLVFDEGKAGEGDCTAISFLLSPRPGQQ